MTISTHDRWWKQGRTTTSAILAGTLWGFGCTPSAAPDNSDQPVGATGADLATRPPLAKSDDWCAGHALPESMCTKCNPQLVEGYRSAGDWCSAHQFPESVCPICHPLSAPSAPARLPGGGDWCPEHRLPESQCTTCNPALRPRFIEAGDWCAEHEFPESVCPICHPSAAETEGPLEGRTIVFDRPTLEDDAGIQTETVRAATRLTKIPCNAQIEFDSDRVASVRAAVPGIVRRVLVGLGDTVKKGQPLFELQSLKVGQFQADLHASREQRRVAKTNLERQQRLRAANISSKRTLELAEQEMAVAEASVRSAQGSLHSAGARSSTRGRRAGRFVVKAPLDGVIVDRPAVVGTLANDNESMATIADTSVMWALCHVPERDAHRVSIGQHLEITLPSPPEQRFTGTVSWVSPSVDPRTRRVAVRAPLINAEGRLRENQFATGLISEELSPLPASQARGLSTELSVPSDSVQRVGTRQVVFVRTEAGRYVTHEVTILSEGPPGFLRVSGPLKIGDLVVVTGAFLLKTELVPGSIGAGCCEVKGPESP